METNIRQSNGRYLSCVCCKFFESWADKYEDELEPSDSGICHNPSNQDADSYFGIDVVCDEFKNFLAK